VKFTEPCRPVSDSVAEPRVPDWILGHTLDPLTSSGSGSSILAESGSGCSHQQGTLVKTISLFSALQEPVVHSAAGQPGPGPTLLVERVLLRQTCGWIPPPKTVEPRLSAGEPGPVSRLSASAQKLSEHMNMSCPCVHSVTLKTQTNGCSRRFSTENPVMCSL